MLFRSFIGKHANDAVFAHFNGVVGAGFQARRVFALHAQGGQEVAFDFGEFAVVVVVDLGAKAAKRHFVFDFAGHRAGVAANAALYIKGHLPSGRG